MLREKESSVADKKIPPACSATGNSFPTGDFLADAISVILGRVSRQSAALELC